MGLNIFIVDGNTPFRTVVQMYLSEYTEHCVVGVDSNGRDFLEKSGEVKVDVVLLGVNVPEMDGVETLMYLRKMCSTQLKVIVLSPYIEIETLKYVHQAGADAYLEKGDFLYEINHVIEKVKNGGTYFPLLQTQNY